MKHMYKLILFNVFILALFGCKKDMIEMNTNEELLVSTDPKFVFTSATENWNNASRGDLMSKYGGVMSLMQYIVPNSGGNENTYANTSKPNNPAPYLPYYNYYYTKYGNKLKYLVDFVIPNRVDKERYINIGAIAKILQTYEAFLLFDTHGSAPYKEALKGLEGNVTPAYDMYEDIYKSLDTTIKAQVNLLLSKPANQVALGNNDYFYQGDVNKWVKFGNTLRIKMAQRFEKVDNAHFQSVLNEVLSNAGGLISNNDESCVYYHNIEYNNDTWDTAILTYQFTASNAFVSFLLGNNDPRLRILIRRNGFGKGNNNPDNDNLADTLSKYYPNYTSDPLYQNYIGRYYGMPASPDLKDGDAAKEYISFKTPDNRAFTIRAVSQVQSRFYVKNGGNAETASGNRNIDYPRYNNNDDMKLFSPQITYPEVCFMMAEISEKAGTAKGGKDAKTWYEDGIRASMEIYQKWGERMKILPAASSEAADYAPISPAMINAYLTQPQIAYSGSSAHKMELIVSQAWVNFFMRPEEAWATWKRTGLPKFKDYNISNPTDGTAFLDKITGGGVELVIPRRSVLPTPNSANINNFNDAVQKLVAKPEYLQPNQTQGRIFWDK